ncbi:hypothetical protein [Mesorhizobium sp.]|uniref:hypothetical protein n=1 Tax=Mesorhizobium sp. TaxID=1871066 RepID=UPI000FE67539|nr:hypothetical protein [Mesorhizobium sp.]RWO08259.1 MAG: hypothetical protein EOS15_30060 [Mesorhizobium sp.]
MTPAAYRAALLRLGLNQTTVAPILGIDARTSRRYAKQGPPPPLARLLAYIERYGIGLAKEMMDRESGKEE